MLIVGLVIGLVLGGLIGYLYSSSTKGGSMPVGDLSAEEVKITTENYINQNLLPPGVTAQVNNVEEKAGLYRLEIAISDGERTQILNSSVSRDGTLFFPDVLDMTQSIPTLPPISEPSTTQTTVDMKALVDDDPAAGGVDASVIVVEFSDFQCPFCASVLPTVKQIKDTYGDKILFVYRDFPLHSIHPEAGKAAEAAQCDNDQDMFWSYHDLLFEKQGDWSGVGVPKFKEYAADLGLDSEKFDECLDTGKYESEVAKDLQEGMHFGVSGTPAFFINGKKIEGAQPFTVFHNIIEEELTKTS
jgi:protein-disulfide isomerase